MEVEYSRNISLLMSIKYEASLNYTVETEKKHRVFFIKMSST